MNFNKPAFNEHYSNQQQAMVTKIIAEIEGRSLELHEAGKSFTTNAAASILAGTATFDFEQQLNVLWRELFGDVAVKDIASDNVDFKATYSQEDKSLCYRIRMRLRSPELKAQNVTSSSIANSMKKTPGMVSQLINGKYAASPTKHLHDIWALIDPNQVAVGGEANNAASLVKPKINIRYGNVPFVPTSVAKLIGMTCAHAKERRRFSVFAGQAGLGKTIALQEYCRENDDAILIKGSEATSSSQILEQLCRSLDLTKTPRVAQNMDRIIFALQDSDRLIILDEADKCKPNSLDPLRTISDNARVGVTLVGNNKLVDKLQTEERFELIASRVCFWPKPMGRIEIEDVKTLFIELTQDTLTLADDSDSWWAWLHKRVEGNARELVENLLPHLLKVSSSAKAKPIDKLLVNSVFSTVLNKPAV